MLAALPALFKFPAWEKEGSLCECMRGGVNEATTRYQNL